MPGFALLLEPGYALDAELRFSVRTKPVCSKMQLQTTWEFFSSNKGGAFGEAVE